MYYEPQKKEVMPFESPTVYDFSQVSYLLHSIPGGVAQHLVGQITDELTKLSQIVECKRFYTHTIVQHVLDNVGSEAGPSKCFTLTAREPSELGDISAHMPMEPKPSGPDVRANSFKPESGSHHFVAEDEIESWYNERKSAQLMDANGDEIKTRNRIRQLQPDGSHATAGLFEAEPSLTPAFDHYSASGTVHFDVKIYVSKLKSTLQDLETYDISRPTISEHGFTTYRIPVQISFEHEPGAFSSQMQVNLTNGGVDGMVVNHGADSTTRIARHIAEKIYLRRPS